MPFVDLDNVRLHYQISGDPEGVPVVFANSLGTDLHLWDQILPLLPAGLKVIRYDKRGHGQSDCPPGPYSMGMLVRDAEGLLDALNIRDCVFVGLSIGGMIAQGLAVKRLDQVRAVVLSNTAAKLGTPQKWAERIDAVRAGGLEAIADQIMQAWFGRAFCTSAAAAQWREKLIAQPVEGYLGLCAAISGTDFYTPTSGLRLPVLGIAGSEDGATPPDLVRETVDLIPGSRFELIRRAGHLPCVDQPQTYADLLGAFLHEIGHLPPRQI